MKRITVAAISSGVALVLLTGCAAGTTTPTGVPPTTSSSSGTPAPATPSSTASTTTSMLLYLIEEEKLAHDVYTVLGTKWNSQVFSNILSSESTHQSEVAVLLTTRGIADPRSATVGVFTNTELQALYDQLIAKGSMSLAEAYAVGVTIEQKDITDITKQLQTATDADVIATLNRLLAASRTHLAAFEGHVG